MPFKRGRQLTLLTSKKIRTLVCLVESILYVCPTRDGRKVTHRSPKNE